MMKHFLTLTGIALGTTGLIPALAQASTGNDSTLLVPEALQSFLYIPWFLLIFALLFLLFVYFRVSRLKKNNISFNERTNDIWKSILTFPSFIGGLGVTLTVLSLAFYAFKGADAAALTTLLPLALCNLIFLFLCRYCYSMLDHFKQSGDTATQS